MPWRSPSLVLLRQMLTIYYPKLQEQVSRGVETLRLTCSCNLGFYLEALQERTDEERQLLG